MTSLIAEGKERCDSYSYPCPTNNNDSLFGCQDAKKRLDRRLNPVFSVYSDAWVGLFLAASRSRVHASVFTSSFNARILAKLIITAVHLSKLVNIGKSSFTRSVSMQSGIVYCENYTGTDVRLAFPRGKNCCGKLFKA